MVRIDARTGRTAGLIDARIVRTDALAVADDREDREASHVVGVWDDSGGGDGRSAQASARSVRGVDVGSS